MRWQIASSQGPVKGPVGAWFTYSEACAPRSLIPGPRHAAGQLGHISACIFLCTLASKCGRISSCVHARPAGIRCDGGSGAGWVQRGHSYAPLQTAFVVARPASEAHVNIWMEAQIQSLRVHTQTTPKNILHTHFTLMDLKRAIGDVGLIFLEEKQIAFEKWKGKRCRLMFTNDNNSVGQLTCNGCINMQIQSMHTVPVKPLTCTACT